MLDENQQVEIDWSAWDIPPIFRLIQDLGNVPEEDMRKSMNLGLGIIYVVKPEGANDFESHMNSLGQSFYNVGVVK